MQTDTLSPFLTVEQVAERYSVSTASILRWKREGNFPRPYRIGRSATRWRLSDLVEHESQLKTCFAVSADWLLPA